MNEVKQQNISFNEFELDTAHNRLLRNGKPVSLYAKTFELLEFLVKNNGRVLTKDEILEAVWEGQIVEEANLSVQISALRKALNEKADSPRFLVTVPGKGYKFVADVGNGKSEIVIEKRKLARITFNEEISNQEETISDFSEKFVPSRKKNFLLSGAFGFVILLGVSFGIYRFANSKNSSLPFQTPKLMRLTNSGTVECVTISPDGNYVAYVLSEKQGNSLWLRQIGTASGIKILEPKNAAFWGITFSPDGKFIYYSLFSPDNIDYELFRIPSLGGFEEKISGISTSRVAFSPDGRQMAFVQTNSGANYNYLSISDTDGKNQKVIAKKNYPDTFYLSVNAVSWSPDGNTIACLVNRFEDEGNYTEIIGINPSDGSERSLSGTRWFEVGSLEWLKDGRGLLVTAKDKPSSDLQIWLVSNPSDEPQKITNDLNQYYEVSVTSDGNAISAIQTNTINGIFVGEIGKKDYTEISKEVGSLNPLGWMPDGKIIFLSKKDGGSNLWEMDADGSNRRQLTVNAEVASYGLCIPPNGKYIVFSSWRSGSLNLWRVDKDGSNLERLTDGISDAYPNCSPDNEAIIFQRGIFSEPTIWKTSIEGGNAEQLTGFHAKWAAISTNGEKISYFKMAEGRWTIGFISDKGQELTQTLDVPKNHKQNKVVWSEDDRSMYYIGADGGVGNIWSLSFSNGKTEPLTDFSSRWLTDFALSPDGRNFAVARSQSFSDVVLIENISPN